MNIQQSQIEALRSGDKSVLRPRPKLALETVPEYLDWVVGNITHMHSQAVDAHLRAAELVVRLRMGQAQAKDTQHTLVRDGVIDPPPAAS